MISNRNIDEFITCAIDILENEKEIVKNGKIKKRILFTDFNIWKCNINR